MNPDLNKFEPLYEEQSQKELAEKLESLVAKTKLVRADGSPVPAHWPVFQEGELVTLKEYTFKVAHIGESYMILEPQKIPVIGEKS